MPPPSTTASVLLLLPAVLSLARASDATSSTARELGTIIQGTADYGDCRESATCSGDGFYCFKRAGGTYAQCRPRETTKCIESGLWDPTRHSASDWLCPGWEYCAATHGNCAFAKCCQNALDACLSRVRPCPHEESTQGRNHDWQTRRMRERIADEIHMRHCTTRGSLSTCQRCLLYHVPCCMPPPHSPCMSSPALTLTLTCTLTLLLCCSCLRPINLSAQHANYAACLPTYTPEVLETLPAGTANRVAAAETAACENLKEMGWECNKLVPETDTCSDDCKSSYLKAT